jgi:hypothetical protein
MYELNSSSATGAGYCWVTTRKCSIVGEDQRNDSQRRVCAVKFTSGLCGTVLSDDQFTLIGGETWRRVSEHWTFLFFKACLRLVRRRVLGLRWVVKSL